MSFKHAKVSYDDTNCINIKGYNDSGKSAFLRAAAVCMMDMFKRNQAKFIRYGEDFFRVAVTFDDGVSIVREKYTNGQSLYEMYQNGKRVYTTKQGNKLTKIDGVPQVIADYLGLCITDNGCLNYQSCVDKLLLVDTTGSENYQELHEVLKTEEIARATTLINSDRNVVSASITEIEEELNSSQTLLRECEAVDEDLIFQMSDRENYAQGLEEKLDSIMDIEKVCGEYENIPNIPEVKKVDSSRLQAVGKIQKLINEYDSVEEIPTIRTVNGGRLKDIGVICKELLQVEEAKKVDIPSISAISKEKVERLSSISNIINNLIEYGKEIKDYMSLMKEIDSIQDELGNLVAQAKAQGHVFKKCDTCGSYVKVEV